MPKKNYRSRSRAVKFRQRKTQVSNTAIGNFTLSKYYYVSMPAATAPAPQPAAILTCNMSSPFNPITTPSGTWTANDSNQEPNGLNAPTWEAYEHCKVLGSTFIVNVTDSPDNAGNSTTEALTEGVVRLNRQSDSTTIISSNDNASLRDFPFQKAKAISLASQVSLSNNLTKNASLKNNYSPRKVWGQNTRSNYNLKVTNTSGSSNTATDNTFMILSIHCANDNVTNTTLKPFKVQIQVKYRILFTEFKPTTNIPRPISTRSRFRSAKASGYAGLGLLGYAAYQSKKIRDAAAYAAIASAPTYRRGWQGYHPFMRY